VGRLRESCAIAHGEKATKRRAERGPARLRIGWDDFSSASETPFVLQGKLEYQLRIVGREYTVFSFGTVWVTR